MRTTSNSTMLTIDVLDKDGYETGRTVEVYIEFIVTVEHEYGADADGNRGTTLVEYDMINSYIEPSVRKTLLAEELAQVLGDAQSRFESNEKHW